VPAAFSHWSASWPAIICYLVVAGAHLTGLRRLREPGRELRDQALVFQGGLLLALLALVSPLGYWSDVYLWLRGLQFLLLAVVSTGLVVLGAPWTALRAAFARRSITPAPAGSRTQPVFSDRNAAARKPWLLARPRLAVLVANAAWLVWELPALSDAARTSAVLATACHVTYLAAGLLFWLQLAGSRPLAPWTTPLRRVRLVVGTAVAFTILGMVLVFGSSAVYPAYAGAAHHVMTVLDDQQLAGAVIWMGSLPPLITAAVALLLRWLNEEESAELSAGFDRLLTPRKDAWSVRPGIR
jgi:putative membrane protein